MFEQLRQRVSERLGQFIIGRSIQRNVDLQPFRARSFRKTLQTKVIEDFPQPQSHLAALHNVRRRSGIKIEDHHGGARNIFRQRKRRMQFDARPDSPARPA